MLRKNLISNFTKLYSNDTNILIHNYILSKDYINLHKLYYHDLYYNKKKKLLLENLNFYDRLYKDYKSFYPNLKNNINNFDVKYNSIYKKYCDVTDVKDKNFDKLIYERSIHYNILYNNLQLDDINYNLLFHDSQYDNKSTYESDLYNKIYFNVYLEIKKSYIY